jgi:hypothetical protein
MKVMGEVDEKGWECCRIARSLVLIACSPLGNGKKDLAKIQQKNHTLYFMCGKVKAVSLNYKANSWKARIKFTPVANCLLCDLFGL